MIKVLNKMADTKTAVKTVAAVLFVSAWFGAVFFILGMSAFYAALVTLLPPLMATYVASVERTFSGGNNE